MTDVVVGEFAGGNVGLFVGAGEGAACVPVGCAVMTAGGNAESFVGAGEASPGVSVGSMDKELAVGDDSVTGVGLGAFVGSDVGLSVGLDSVGAPVDSIA